MKLDTSALRIFKVIIAGMIVAFCLYMLFGGFAYNGKTGVLAVLGNLPAKEKADTLIDESLKAMREIQAMPAPEVRYVGNVCVVEQEANFKSMFQVKLPGESNYRDGITENEFSIRLEDITDTQGNSCLIDADGALIESSEEIITALTYEQDTGSIVFHQSGVYEMYIAVYGENGRITRKVVSIPVEINNL